MGQIKKIIFIFFICASSAVHGDVDPDKIIGENDLVIVKKDKTNIPFKYRNMIEAIGLMDVGCTVTHIGNGYAVTAGHCVWTRFFEEIPVTPFVDLPCKDEFDHQFEIWWGYRGEENDQPVSKGLCERIVYAQVTPFYDFAILKVTNPPKAKIAVDLEKQASLGDRITIFSHVDSLPLQWSKSCSVKRIVNSEITPKAIMHVCDTNPGSSGAAIIDMETFKIVGLHNGGIFFDELKDPPPEDLFEPGLNGLGINYGTYITDSPLRPILKKLGF